MGSDFRVRQLASAGTTPRLISRVWEIECSYFSQCDPHETNLVLTEAPNCPQALQTNCDQIIFEEFEFASYCRHLGT